MSDDLTAMLEHFFEGGSKMKYTEYSEEKFKEVIGYAAKEIAIYHTATYPALAKIEKSTEKPFISKYHDIIFTKGGLAMVKGLQAHPEVCDVFKKCLAECQAFFEKDEIVNFLENFNAQNYVFVMAHNDMNSGNIMWKEDEKRMVIIDFELSGPNGLYFDLAYMFMLNNFTKDEAKFHFTFEPKEYVTDEFLKKILSIYLNELNIPDQPSSEWDLDQELGVFLETMKLISMVPIIMGGFLIAVYKKQVRDPHTFTYCGLQSFDYWSGRFDQYKSNQ
jgi:hypothetical protein